jgi:hypothetical protein
MSDQSKIVACEVPRHGVLRVTWEDGFSGNVDLHCTIERGGVYGFLVDPAAFAKVAIAEDGEALVWRDPDGDRIGFGTETLRVRAGKRVFDAAA